MRGQLPPLTWLPGGQCRRLHRTLKVKLTMVSVSQGQHHFGCTCRQHVKQDVKHTKSLHSSARRINQKLCMSRLQITPYTLPLCWPSRKKLDLFMLRAPEMLLRCLPERSTLLGSLPEKAPPPCAPHPP